jgi:hypothetical protein
MTEARFAGLGLTPTVWVWGKLAACALLIGLTGPEHAKSGDIIANGTGLSQSSIGSSCSPQPRPCRNSKLTPTASPTR